MEKINEAPLISVIVPIYNVKDYVHKCIKSIQKQTYKNLEIILVDDGSTDGCGEICDEYSSFDDRVIAYHKVNGGLSDARNYGIDRCHGDLLGFVDGDDWIHPQMYEIMVKHMKANQADVVACWFDREDKESFLRKIQENEIKVKILTGAQALIDIEIPLVVAWNKLYKRNIFKNLRYPVGRLHEDEFVIHRIFKQCKKVCVVDSALYFYTERGNSIVATMTEKRIDDSLAAFKDRVKFSAENGWSEVMPAVVKRYCDYCIDRYCDIKNEIYHLPETVSNKLWNSARVMCERYPDVNIGKKYYKFAESPAEYFRYMALLRKKQWMKDMVLKIKRTIRRRFNSDI